MKYCEDDESAAPCLSAISGSVGAGPCLSHAEFKATKCMLRIMLSVFVDLVPVHFFICLVMELALLDLFMS